MAQPKSKSQAFREIVSQCMSQGMSHHEAVAQAESMTASMPENPLAETQPIKEAQIKSTENLN